MPLSGDVTREDVHVTGIHGEHAHFRPSEHLQASKRSGGTSSIKLYWLLSGALAKTANNKNNSARPNKLARQFSRGSQSVEPST